VGASIGQKGVHALKTGRVGDRTKRGPPDDDRSTNQGEKHEAPALAVKGRQDKMEYRQHMVARGRYRIYASDYPGEEPAIVLMHGFPDNLHLYDRLVPHLSGRRVVVFDFLGWGGSDKPSGYPYTADNQTRDLGAVIRHLGLDSVVLVAHDASGPPAIDWALAHPERTAALVLLNTYYGRTSSLRRPEAIFLFSTPVLRNVARFVSGRFDLFRRIYWWQVGKRFIRNEEVREEFVPLLYEQFAATPSTKLASSLSITTFWVPLGAGPEPSPRCGPSGVL
jgi:haloalkane dehalogenase